MSDPQSETASFPTHAIASLIAREAKLMGYSVRRSAAGPSSRSAYIFCDSIKVRVADHAARGTIDMDVHADMPRPGSLSHREAIAQLRANLSSERLCGLVGKTRPLTLPRANTKVSGMSSKDNTALGISVGDRIQHKREPGWTGVVTAVDADCYLADAYGVTTCEVQWDDAPAGDVDVQWTNRIEVLS